ncbi:MAG: hybrid sensor histidine kinase/response regulator [Planctomycetota bacterium]|jgi:signal transduction histidine kinase
MVTHDVHAPGIDDDPEGHALEQDLLSDPRKDKRVVVLGGDKCRQRLASDTLSGLGIELLTTATSEQALETLSRTQVRVFVTEPNASGVDFLSALRERFPGLAIIVITGFDDVHLVTDTELGSVASTILSEPCTQEDVVVAIRNAFRHGTLSSGAEALGKTGKTKPTRVLLVEDDLPTRAFLSVQLKEQGYEVSGVEDGIAAFEALEEGDFDILLTDIAMPRMDGIELTQKVKEIRPRLPVIALSAAGDAETSLNALRAGAYCYVVKPADIQELSLFMDRSMLADMLERNLRQKNALLEERTEELTKALTELREQSEIQAQSRSAAMSRLAADVAHELKNPLNSIRASFAYMCSRLPRELVEANPKIAKHADIVELQIQRSQDIIEGMLTCAQPGEGGGPPTQVNDLLRECARLALMAREKVHVCFELDPDLPSTPASAAALKRVFENLVINAAKAMKNEGMLTIRTEPVGDEDIRITFADTGPGVPPGIIDRIFDPFFSTDRNEGTGLGLSICKEAMTQCGGSIAVSNAAAGGAVFTITLPQMEPVGVLSR